MSRPRYCPHCGEILPGGEHGATPFSNTQTGDGGWDCYCDACEWSGDIRPDEEAEMYTTTPPYERKEEA